MTLSAQTLATMLTELLSITKLGISSATWCDEVELHPTAFVRGDNIVLSAEAESSWAWVDYYGEYHGGLPYICPELEEFARKHCCYWEWNDPGSVTLYES